MASRRPKSKLRRTLEQGFLSRLTACGSWIACRLPRSWAYAAANAVAALIMVGSPRRQRLAETNLAATFPELAPAEVRRVRRASVRSIFRTLVELLMLPALAPEDLRQLVDTSELEAVAPLLADDRGTVFVTGHLGNWEWFGALLGQGGKRFSAVALDAPHQTTSGLINNARASHGVNVIHRDDLRQMISVLRDGEILGILPDQHAYAGGEWLEFLGRPGWTFTSPALLAARTGARVVTGFCIRQADGRYRVEGVCEVPLVDSGDRDADLITNTVRINVEVEAAIRRHPEQWLWMHDRWKQRRKLQETGEGPHAPN